MDNFKSYYFIWLLIILTCFSIGLFFFLEYPQSETVPETEIVEQSTPPQLTPKQTIVNELKANLSIEQQIGQLILAKVPDVNQIEDIQQYFPGGFLVFAKDTIGENSETFKQKIASWQSAAKTPMIIASDEEGGVVTRVSGILPQAFFAPGDLYANGGFDLIRQKEGEKAQILKSIGINVNLAPVADVAVNPTSYIYDRTLKLPAETALIDAANLTAQYVTTVVSEYQKIPIGSCLKHFPGYGENADSHTDVITDVRTLDVLQTIDFIPFQAGIQAGAGSILVSHNVCTALDPTLPASQSPIVQAVLRNDFNFHGVIMCDDLDMQGLTKRIDKSSAAVQAINCGTDMIICSNYNEIIPRIKADLDSGIISQQRFNEAVDHVLNWKYDLGLI